jgi:hypothetical protein
MTKDSTTNGPFFNILIFSKKGIFEGFLLQLFFKTLKIPPMNYITCVNYFWINMNFPKVYKFC